MKSFKEYNDQRIDEIFGLENLTGMSPSELAAWTAAGSATYISGKYGLAGKLHRKIKSKDGYRKAGKFALKATTKTLGGLGKAATWSADKLVKGATALKDALTRRRKERASASDTATNSTHTSSAELPPQPILSRNEKKRRRELMAGVDRAFRGDRSALTSGRRDTVSGEELVAGQSKSRNQEVLGRIGGKQLATAEKERQKDISSTGLRLAGMKSKIVDKKNKLQKGASSISIRNYNQAQAQAIQKLGLRGRSISKNPELVSRLSAARIKAAQNVDNRVMGAFESKEFLNSVLKFIF